MLQKITKTIQSLRSRPLEINIKPRAWWQSLKKTLTSTPVKVNDKPVALWKLLLPITLIGLISLISPIVSNLNRPPTPDEIAATKYQQAKEQADLLSKTVAGQADVPKDETPNVATIDDVTKLQGQSFFKLAQNGDKLLIYEKRKMIVLYRPSDKKVIATAPVLYNQPQTAVAGTESAETVSSQSATN